MRILVRVSNWLGDVVMGTAALSRLAELHPGADLWVHAPKGIREILLHHPAISRLLDLPLSKGMGAPFRLGGALRRLNIDRIYLFPNSFSSALAAWWAGIPTRVGYAQEGRRPLLTDVRPHDARALELHMVHYYLNLVEPGGAWGLEHRPRIYLTEEERSWAERYLAEAGVVRGDWLVGLNPGAVGGSAKRWPADRFAELAGRLARERQARLLLFGNAAERALTDEIAARAGVRLINTAGETNLRQLAALMARCAWVVSNDTGGMHVADAVGARVLALIGPTRHENTRPFGANHVIVRESVDCSPYRQPCMLKECPIDHRCMTAIRVDRVWEALREA